MKNHVINDLMSLSLQKTLFGFLLWIYPLGSYLVCW